MKSLNGNLTRLAMIITLTSGLSIANNKTSSTDAGTPLLANARDSFNPTAYTNKPQAKINKSAILKAQRLLKNRGFLNTSPDGISGHDTKRAVKAYQIDKNLDVTGVLNKETLSAMSIDWNESNKTF